MSHGSIVSRIASVLPCLLLVGVGVTQVTLARTVGLSAWSGGGFGMFSTNDAGLSRHLHAFVLRPGIVREVEIPDALRAEVGRALTFPSTSSLERLAPTIAGLPTPDQGEATGVRLQVWHTRYDPEGLTPSSRLLRGLDIPLAASAD